MGGSSSKKAKPQPAPPPPPPQPQRAAPVRRVSVSVSARLPAAVVGPRYDKMVMAKCVGCQDDFRPKKCFDLRNTASGCPHRWCPECIVRNVDLSISKQRLQWRCPEGIDGHGNACDDQSVEGYTDCRLVLKPSDLSHFDFSQCELGHDVKAITARVAWKTATAIRRTTACPDCKTVATLKPGCKDQSVFCPKDGCGAAFCFWCGGKWNGKTCVNGCTEDLRLKELRTCGTEAKWLVPTPDTPADVKATQNAAGQVKVDVPQQRVCPRCSCKVSWGSRCKHIVCPACHQEFCYVCLDLEWPGRSQWVADARNWCPLAPVQTDLPVYDPTI